MHMLTGILPALLTPFDARGAIDEKALRALVDRNIKAGVQGFYVCGSTGESFLMSHEERKRVLEIVMSEVAGRVAVICHVGAIGTDLSIGLGKHAVAQGVDAISSLPPFYYKFSAREIIDYYLELARETDSRLIPYNIPSLSGVSLSEDLVAELRRDSRVIGIKFTSNDLYQLERMRHHDPKLIIYNGFDEMFLAGLSMGAWGAIGSTFNFMADKFLAIKKAFDGKDMGAAFRLQEEANTVLEALIKTGSVFAAEKYVLSVLGCPVGECRRPFKPLSDDNKRMLREMAEKHLMK
jgi:N-acetylneuraminate lyase